MKDQYVGDIGDYGKYGMLRYLADHGVKIGVNWYLTENDQTNAGRIVSYLNDPAKARYDPPLFHGMKELAFREDKGVALVEAAALIPGAVYYSARLHSEDLAVKDRYAARQKWQDDGQRALEGAELIFCDPDNGPLGRKTIGARQSEKYVSLAEIGDHYRRGQNVVYYCHKARRTAAAWERVKGEALSVAPDATIFTLTFHGGTQRSYIFVIHPGDADRYRALADGFLATEWRDYFSRE